jgi:membrane-bound ClpP family serine protease
MHLIAWISGALAVILMLLGIIALVFNKPFFDTVNIVKYFHVANSFLLLGIFCLLNKLLMNKK